ncbi:NADP-dependent malic enzyme [Candidatus Roizmanbacteria bacterium]|nr:NADP-dependent malic enzyme [Candidatus Roizmanbacteria bacterium]
MNINQQALKLHYKLKGKIAIVPKIKIKNRRQLSLIYTPGVAAVSQYLAKNKNNLSDYTIKNNSVAVVSDGSAVLGLGNIGLEGALPVMEGKCLIFKSFANIDAFPIVLSTQDPDEIIRTVVAIAPGFGGINLEDIAAPGCFYIEKALKKQLDIPVVHDDQWGTATVVLAALINSLKVVEKKIDQVKIVILGAGAAGSAVVKILNAFGGKNILVCDRQGIIYQGRKGSSPEKEGLAKITNPNQEKGDLAFALKRADVLIGVSGANLVTASMADAMEKQAIIFAMANPDPEIRPDVAKKSGVYIYASGRSDIPNQVNNALVFPGIFRGALDQKVKEITLAMLIKAAKNLASLVKNPTAKKIVPSIFDKGVVSAVAKAIK